MLGMSKALLVALGGVLAAAVASPALANAQQQTSVTGCLSKGATKDSYTLQGSDGKSYSLTSSTVKLDQHLGHKVTVTGKATGMETGAMMDTSMKKAAPPSKETGAMGATLDVSSLKMVGTDCK